MNWTIEAMLYYGTGFVRELGRLASSADNRDLRKIKEMWPEIWYKYSEVGHLMAQQMNVECACGGVPEHKRTKHFQER